MAEQKYCRECGEYTPVLGQVDYSKKSKRVVWQKSDTEKGLLYLFPSVHEKDLCYYHEKMAEKNRRLEGGVPKYYLRQSRPKSKVQTKVKVIKRR